MLSQLHEKLSHTLSPVRCHLLVCEVLLVISSFSMMFVRDQHLALLATASNSSFTPEPAQNPYRPSRTTNTREDEFKIFYLHSSAAFLFSLVLMSHSYFLNQIYLG